MLHVLLDSLITVDYKLIITYAFSLFYKVLTIVIFLSIIAIIFFPLINRSLLLLFIEIACLELLLSYLLFVMLLRILFLRAIV